ncbi:unnamed protein product [Gongylonema pulchrum]|uniref:HEAT repeat-containing protein 1 n=1 Tax=Gongylonema pulchrum TaxID=637853 RepID=A0A183E817_9BILA|nr:unnamed protein product [Gongylonema pulchrum]
MPKLTSPSYLKNHMPSDFEKFFVEMITVALSEGAHINTPLKIALSQLPVNVDFALSLLKPFTEQKTKKRDRSLCHWDCFKTEDCTQFESRRRFALEVLIANDSLQASAKLFQLLYEILKEAIVKQADDDSQYSQQLVINFIICLIKNPRGYKVTVNDLHLDTVVDIVRHTQSHRILRDCLNLLTCAVVVAPVSFLDQFQAIGKQADDDSQYLQQLVINFIIRLIKNPRGYKVTVNDLHLDTVVDIVRHTQSHRILRDCLNLLTCAVVVAPKKVLAHLMSVYTFMGDGLLKKDNDLTLSDPSFYDQIITTSRLFAASIADIPAHRRESILRAVARSTTSRYVLRVAFQFRNCTLALTYIASLLIAILQVILTSVSFPEYNLIISRSSS